MLVGLVPASDLMVGRAGNRFLMCMCIKGICLLISCKIYGDEELLLWLLEHSPTFFRSQILKSRFSSGTPIIRSFFVSRNWNGKIIPERKTIFWFCPLRRRWWWSRKREQRQNVHLIFLFINTTSNQQFSFSFLFAPDKHSKSFHRINYLFINFVFYLKQNDNNNTCLAVVVVRILFYFWWGGFWFFAFHTPSFGLLTSQNEILLIFNFYFVRLSYAYISNHFISSFIFSICILFRIPLHSLLWRFSLSLSDG